MEMPYLAEYMTDSGMAAALRLGLDGGQDTPPCCIPIIHNERQASPTVAPVQAARTTELLSTSLSALTERAAP